MDTRRIGWGLGLVLLSLAALAQQEGGDTSRGSGRRPPGPPPEAYEACVGKSEGAAVSVTLRDGKTVPGVCRLVGDKLAAMPLRPSGGSGMGGSSGASAEVMPPPPDGSRQ